VLGDSAQEHSIPGIILTAGGCCKYPLVGGHELHAQTFALLGQVFADSVDLCQRDVGAG
jgi:hypothetical protein